MIARIVGIIIAVAIVWGIAGVYSNLVTLRNRVDGTWQDIDGRLVFRSELAALLIDTVRGHLPESSETLGAAAVARATADAASAPAERIAADAELGAALRNLLDTAQGVPELEGNATFTRLRAALEDADDRIAHLCRDYNDRVLAYNNGIQTFPGALFAGIFQFKERTGFEAAAGAHDTPDAAHTRL